MIGQTSPSLTDPPSPTTFGDHASSATPHNLQPTKSNVPIARLKKSGVYEYPLPLPLSTKNKSEKTTDSPKTPTTPKRQQTKECAMGQSKKKAKVSREHSAKKGRPSPSFENPTKGVARNNASEEESAKVFALTDHHCQLNAYRGLNSDLGEGTDDDWLPSKGDGAPLPRRPRTRSSPRKHHRQNSNPTPRSPSRPRSVPSDAQVKHEDDFAPDSWMPRIPSPPVWAPCVRSKRLDDDGFVELPRLVVEYEETKKRLERQKRLIDQQKQEEKGKLPDRLVEKTSEGELGIVPGNSEEKVDKHKLRGDAVVHSNVDKVPRVKTSKETLGPSIKPEIDVQESNQLVQESVPQHRSSREISYDRCQPVTPSHVGPPLFDPVMQSTKPTDQRWNGSHTVRQQEAGISNRSSRCKCENLPYAFTRNPKRIPSMERWGGNPSQYLEYSRKIAECSGHAKHLRRFCRKVLERHRYAIPTKEQSIEIALDFAYDILSSKTTDIQGKPSSNTSPANTSGRLGSDQTRSESTDVSKSPFLIRTKTIDRATIDTEPQNPVHRNSSWRKPHPFAKATDEGLTNVVSGDKLEAKLMSGSTILRRSSNDNTTVLPSTTDPDLANRSSPLATDFPPITQGRKPGKKRPRDEVETMHTPKGASIRSPSKPCKKRHQSMPASSNTSKTHVTKPVVSIDAYGRDLEPARPSNSISTTVAALDPLLAGIRTLTDRVKRVENMLEQNTPASIPSNSPAQASNHSIATINLGITESSGTSLSTYARRMANKPALSRDVPLHLRKSQSALIAIGKERCRYSRHIQAPEAFTRTGRLLAEFDYLLDLRDANGDPVWDGKTISRLKSSS